MNDGRVILTGSPDLSIRVTDVETGSAICGRERAHSSAINRLISLTKYTFASGDDGGCIKVQDIRQSACCNTFSHHEIEGSISDMTFAADSMKLVATSGDGFLFVCDLRGNELQNRSKLKEEALSVVIMKNGREVVCGSNVGNGKLLFYTWGFYEDCSGSFEISTFSDSVDALLKFDEDRIIAGSGNGVISLVSILPNRLVKRIADSEFPVQRLAFSHDKKFLGSISDEILMLWETDEILKDSETNEMEYLDIDPPNSDTGNKSASKYHLQRSSQNFFSDLEMEC